MECPVCKKGAIVPCSDYEEIEGSAVLVTWEECTNCGFVFEEE